MRQLWNPECYTFSLIHLVHKNQNLHNHKKLLLRSKKSNIVGKAFQMKQWFSENSEKEKWKSINLEIALRHAPSKWFKTNSSFEFSKFQLLWRVLAGYGGFVGLLLGVFACVVGIPTISRGKSRYICTGLLCMMPK